MRRLVAKIVGTPLQVTSIEMAKWFGLSAFYKTNSAFGESWIDAFFLYGKWRRDFPFKQAKKIFQENMPVIGKNSKCFLWKCFRIYSRVPNNRRVGINV